MPDLLQHATYYFRTFEEREEAFRKSAFSLIPRKHLGPVPFWRDLAAISQGGFAGISASPVAFVTSNPRDCLAFGTPRQVLTAACLTGGVSGRRLPAAVDGAAEAFGVTETLHQPVRTLSGGETVKLALAKSYAVAAGTTRLAVASPFCWLSHDNSSYFDRLIRHYRRLGLPVELFALEGEDSEDPVDAGEAGGTDSWEPVSFDLRLDGVRLNLGTSVNTLYSHRTRVRLADFAETAASPCLLIGGNGQGKSLLARILAGAVSHGGSARVESDGRSGGARLLFQDVITQTLLRSFDALVDACTEKERALALYDEILTRFDTRSGETAARSPGRPAGSAASLLEVKTILVAARLFPPPAALILDEPDWGLSRSDAAAFVTAVVGVAHRLGVPVMIISHKPWWRRVAAGGLRVERTPTVRRGERESRFSIRLRREEPEAP